MLHHISCVCVYLKGEVSTTLRAIVHITMKVYNSYRHHLGSLRKASIAHVNAIVECGFTLCIKHMARYLGFGQKGCP